MIVVKILEFLFDIYKNDESDNFFSVAKRALNVVNVGSGIF